MRWFHHRATSKNLKDLAGRDCFIFNLGAPAVRRSLIGKAGQRHHEIIVGRNLPPIDKPRSIFQRQHPIAAPLREHS